MLCLKCYTIDPSGCADAHLLNADEQNLDASSNSSSVKSLEKELLVLCQDKEEKYPVELMEWVDEESMGAFLAADEELSTVATDAELNEAITDEFGVKYSKDGIKLLKAPQNLDGTYSVKKGTKIICDMAFYDYSSWSSLVIPDSVIIIGFGAFEGCSSLRSLVIPDSVTSIGDDAFWFCSSLRNLVIPDSVTAIGDRAFSGCCSLESLVVPDSVASIGNKAFRGCNLPDNLKQELISRFGENIFG